MTRVPPFADMPARDTMNVAERAEHKADLRKSGLAKKHANIGRVDIELVAEVDESEPEAESSGLFRDLAGKC